MRINSNDFNKELKDQGADKLLWKHIQGKITLNKEQLKLVIQERKK